MADSSKLLGVVKKKTPQDHTDKPAGPSQASVSCAAQPIEPMSPKMGDIPEDMGYAPNDPQPGCSNDVVQYSESSLSTSEDEKLIIDLDPPASPSADAIFTDEAGPRRPPPPPYMTARRLASKKRWIEFHL